MVAWRKANSERLKAERQQPEYKEKARKSTAEYRRRNPEKDAASAKAHYARHASKYAAKALARYHENAADRAIYRAGYYQRTRSEALAYAKRYRSANPEAVALAGKNYKKNNRAAVSLVTRNWRAKNPELARRHNHTRRARAGGLAISRVVIGGLLRTQRWACVNCMASLKKTGYHVDHIMPLALGGTNTDDNVQLLCPACNLSKSSKHPIDWAQANGRLL